MQWGVLLRKLYRGCHISTLINWSIPAQDSVLIADKKISPPRLDRHQFAQHADIRWNTKNSWKTKRILQQMNRSLLNDLLRWNLIYSSKKNIIQSIVNSINRIDSYYPVLVCGNHCWKKYEFTLSEMITGFVEQLNLFTEHEKWM